MSKNEYVGFERNDKNEYIEGYLSDKEHFNGVLFLLREPNTKGKRQKEFWFKNSLEKNSRQRSFSLYKNKFNIYLKYLNGEYNLSDCAYANIIPTDGKKSKSDKYRKINNENIRNRFISIVNECNNKIKFVFTCYDIFDALKETENSQPVEGMGIKYRKSDKTKRVIRIGNITVYEIYHPSYTKYPKEKSYDNDKPQ